MFLCLSLASAEAPQEAPDQPFSMVDVLARKDDALVRAIVALTEGPLLPDGSARFALGGDDRLLDFARRPPRPLTVEEVTLLLALQEAAAKSNDATRLRQAAALARRHPALFNGPRAAEEAAGYLEAVASGATDRVAPRDLVPPPKPVPPPAEVLAAAPGLPGPARAAAVSAPLRPLSPDKFTPPSPTAPDESTGYIRAAYRTVAGWLGLTSPPPPPALPDGGAGPPPEDPKPPIRIIYSDRRDFYDSPDPSGRLWAMRGEFPDPKPLLESKNPADFTVAVQIMGFSDTPEAKALLRIALSRLEKEVSGKHGAQWSFALLGLTRALDHQKSLDPKAAARLAAMARSLTRRDPSASVRRMHWRLWWPLLTEAAKADPEAAKAVEETRAAVVGDVLAEQAKRLADGDAFPLFAEAREYQQPPFKDDARVVEFMRAGLAHAADGQPKNPEDRMAALEVAWGVLSERAAGTPESAVQAAESLARIAAAAPPSRSFALRADDLFFRLQMSLPFEIFLAKLVTADAVSKGPPPPPPPPTSRERVEAVRRRLADAFLPGLLADFKDPAKREEALEFAGSSVMSGDSRVLRAFLAETASAAPKAQRSTQFARVVQSVYKLGRVDPKAAAELTAAARRLNILTPPEAGSGEDWHAYLRGVETSRNAIRAGILSPADRERALLAFDAAFAAAYDKERTPATPRAALESLLADSASWLPAGQFDGWNAFGYDQARGGFYDLAIRETAVRFFDQASRTHPAYADLAARARKGRLAPAPAAGEDAAKAAAAAGSYFAPHPGLPPMTATDIYLHAYRLENLRSTSAALPENDPRREKLAAAVAEHGRFLVYGLEELDALSYEDRTHDAGGSRDQTHARMTALLALPPGVRSDFLRRRPGAWLDANGPLGAPYFAYGSVKPERDSAARGGAAASVMMNLVAFRAAENPAERHVRMDGLEQALLNFSRHEPILRATMHRSIPMTKHHLNEAVGLSGSDGLAPYYYPSTIPHVITAYGELLRDPSVRADPTRLARLEAGYRTARDGLLREFDTGGLRKPMRRQLPWLYTLLGDGVAQVAALETPSGAR